MAGGGAGRPGPVGPGPGPSLARGPFRGAALTRVSCRNTTISLLTTDDAMVSIDPTMPANSER